MPAPTSPAPGGSAARVRAMTRSTLAASCSLVDPRPVGARWRLPGSSAPSSPTSAASTFVPPRSIASAYPVVLTKSADEAADSWQQHTVAGASTALRTGPDVPSSVASSMFSLERDYEFPRVIVWDALVDADLVSGWLAESTIAGELGGRYELRWSQRAGEPVTSGRITALRRPELLHVEAEDLTMRFELEELSGGDRGTSTRLRLAVAVDPALAAMRLEADWLTTPGPTARPALRASGGLGESGQRRALVAIPRRSRELIGVATLRPRPGTGHGATTRPRLGG